MNHNVATAADYENQEVIRGKEDDRDAYGTGEKALRAIQC